MHPQPTTTPTPQHPIVIYIRVSTPKQRDEGYSLDRQRREAVAEAVDEAQRQGYPVPPEGDILVDADSGTTCHRAGRKTLWEWVARDEVRSVIIPNVDRMGRGARDNLDLEHHLSAHGVRLILLKERVDTKTPSGMFFFQVMAALAELELNTIRDRMRGGKQEKLERGEAWATDNSAPYGYEYVKPANKHTPAIECFRVVPEHARVVKRAIELVAGGMSAQKVAELFTIEGEFTARGATTWRASTIRRWVYNTAYQGDLPRNKYQVIREADTVTQRGKRRTRELPEAGKTLPITPIVDREVCERARANLQEGNRRSSRNLKYEYLLWTPRGDALLLCGKCLQEGRTTQLSGRTNSSSTNGKTYTYASYQCLHQQHDGRKGKHFVGRDKLDNAVWTELCDILSQPQNVMADLQKLADHTSAVARALEAELATIRAQREDLDIQEDRLIEMGTLGTLRREKLEARAATLAAQRRQVDAREEELHEQIRAAREEQVPVHDIEEACRLVRKWLGKDPPFDVKRKVVRALLTRVVAWLEDTDGEGKSRKAGKRLHIHLEGRLPSLCAEGADVPAFIDMADQCHVRKSRYSFAYDRIVR